LNLASSGTSKKSRGTERKEREVSGAKPCVKERNTDTFTFSRKKSYKTPKVRKKRIVNRPK